MHAPGTIPDSDYRLHLTALLTRRSLEAAAARACAAQCHARKVDQRPGHIRRRPGTGKRSRGHGGILVSVEATFDTVLRGYDPRQVDTLLDQAEQALASDRWHLRKAVLDALRSTSFRRRLSGYDSDQVDRYIQELIRRLG